MGLTPTLTRFPITTIHPRDSGRIDVLPVSGRIPLGILLLAGVISGVCGNILVLIVILLNKRLHNQIANLMILNLAITDLVMACFPMPVLGAYFVFDWPEWKFGDFMCKAAVYIASVSSYDGIDRF